jgi:hypothetical protein
MQKYDFIFNLSIFSFLQYISRYKLKILTKKIKNKKISGKNRKKWPKILINIWYKISKKSFKIRNLSVPLV